MCETRSSIAAIFHQDPFVMNTPPVVPDLRTLQEQRAVRVLRTDGALPHSRKPFLAYHVNDEYATLFEAVMNIQQHLKIVFFICKVAKRGEEITGEIETWVGYSLLCVKNAVGVS